MKVYSKQERAEILATAKEKGVAKAATIYGVAEGTIYAWRSKSRQAAKKAAKKVAKKAAGNGKAVHPRAAALGAVGLGEIEQQLETALTNVRILRSAFRTVFGED